MNVYTCLISSLLACFTCLRSESADNYISKEYSDTTLSLKEIRISAVKQTASDEAKAGARSALSRTTVERMNITTAKNASAIIPNFFVPDYGSRVTSSIYVRGIGARIDQPAVGLNVDNIPVLNKDNYDFDILDIDRIEIARGPQSIMYGRNAMGGMINVRTLSPLSYQGTRFLAEYGNGNSMKAGISHYAMPSQKFGIGGSFLAYRSDGFFKNLHNNENCDKERSLRASLKTVWMPSDKLTIENAASASVLRQGGYAYESTETRQINYNDTCFYRRTSVLDGLTVGWQGGHFSVTSVTSYQYISDNMTLDQDFLPLSYFTLTQKRKEHAITEDLIVKGPESSRIRWLGGIFGFYRHADIKAPVTFKDYGIENMIESHWNAMNSQYPIRWDTREFELGSAFTMPSYGAAAYGEASAAFGRFTVVAGLRLDYETSKLDYRSDCSTAYTIYHRQPDGSLATYLPKKMEIHIPGKLSRSFTQLLPKLALTYQLPTEEDNSLYLSAAKGYKAGGFNTQMFSDVLQQELMGQMGIGKRYDIDDVVGYKPEYSWNYEIGGKFNFADGKAAAEITAFYIDCRNQQLTVFPDGTTTGRIMANAGKTRSAGAELSLMLRPINRLELRASYGYTNAKFVDFNNGQQNYAGNFIPYAPQNTIFASAMYSFRIRTDFLRYISLGAETTAAGRIYWNEENSLSQNIYALLNANARFSGEKYSLNLWIKNATGTQYNTFYFVSIEHEFLQRGKPVQFGATLRINI